MSEIATPTVDGLEFYASWGCAGDGGQVILADDARELERENTTLSARVAALEEELRKCANVLQGAGTMLQEYPDWQRTAIETHQSATQLLTPTEA